MRVDDPAIHEFLHTEYPHLVAAVALVLNLLLMPVLGISFWARDRGFRQQAAALADAQDRAGPPPVSQPRDPYA